MFLLHNNYGVRSVVLYVDTTEVFRSTVDGVLPEENRMINAWTDYEENVKRHNHWRTWRSSVFDFIGIEL